MIFLLQDPAYSLQPSLFISSDPVRKYPFYSNFQNILLKTFVRVIPKAKLNIIVNRVSLSSGWPVEDRDYIFHVRGKSTLWKLMAELEILKLCALICKMSHSVTISISKAGYYN